MGLLTYKTGMPICGDERVGIAEEVATALATDPRTASSRLEVVFDRGVLILMGVVQSELAHDAAEEIAHQNDSVLSVTNAIEVLPKEGFADTVANAFAEMFG